MHQLFIPGFSGGPIKPTNLLPTGVIVTSNKNHKAPSVPRVSVLSQKLTRSVNGAFALIQSTLCDFVLCASFVRFLHLGRFYRGVPDDSAGQRVGNSLLRSNQ